MSDYIPPKEALRRHGVAYQLILHNAPDAIVVINRYGCMTLVNAETENIFGFHQSELLNQPIEIILPEYADRAKDWPGSNQGPAPLRQRMPAGLELVGKHKDGSEFPAIIKLNEINLDDGRHHIIIIRDITDFKQAEMQIIQAERLAALGKMTTALAHEVSNPLQIIQGYLDLIQDFGLESREKELYLQIIRDEIERLMDINRRVLDYSDPQKAPFRLVFIADLIEKVLIFANKQLTQSDIQVTLDLENTHPVMAAPDLLMQVFLNLVINTTEIRSANCTLHITLHEENGYIFVSFINNGPPIPAEILPHIFEPFFTTKPEGNGLGLWVSHNLVQRHNGSISAENLAEGKGVKFTVSLPAVKIQEEVNAGGTA